MPVVSLKENSKCSLFEDSDENTANWLRKRTVGMIGWKGLLFIITVIFINQKSILANKKTLIFINENLSYLIK